MANVAEPTGAGRPLLQVERLAAGYGKIRALHGIGLTVHEARIVCVLGANGAGKTTLMRVLSGLLPVMDGTVQFDGQSIANVPAETLVRRGIVHVPQGRMVFAQLSVRENLMLGGYTRPAGEVRDHITHVLDYFPRLKERIGSRAGTLSGGEQQMLAMARAMATDPALLILDELSMGLAPLVVHELYEQVAAIAATGISILVVEQFAHEVLGVADTAAIMLHGRIATVGAPTAIAAELETAYLSGAMAEPSP